MLRTDTVQSALFILSSPGLHFKHYIHCLQLAPKIVIQGILLSGGGIFVSKFVLGDECTFQIIHCSFVSCFVGSCFPGVIEWWTA